MSQNLHSLRVSLQTSEARWGISEFTADGVRRARTDAGAPEKSILTSAGVTVCALLLLFILRDVQTGFSGSDPLSENTDLRSTPAALASLSSIPAGGSGETWQSDQICRSRSYSSILSDLCQRCHGDAFLRAAVYALALRNIVQKYRHYMN